MKLKQGMKQRCITIKSDKLCSCGHRKRFLNMGKDVLKQQWQEKCCKCGKVLI